MSNYFEIAKRTNAILLDASNFRLDYFPILSCIKSSLELGRYLVGEAGYYVTQIVDIKESKGKKYIITAEGINHQRRPCATKTNHPIEIINLDKPYLYSDQLTITDETAEIGGPLCINDDILGKSIYIPKANISDLIVVLNSGAYGLSMAAVNFLSHEIAPEYIVDK